MTEVNKLLVVGSGGREFALMEEALRAGVQDVFSTRRENAVNYGIEGVLNTGLGEKDFDAIGKFAVENKVQLVVVGPEAPLIAGIGDALRQGGITVFGPDTSGAAFEKDKTITHEFVERHGLPNPDDSETYTPDQRDSAILHILSKGSDKIVTKRVGQESGKGAKKYTENELEAALREVYEVAAKGESLLIQSRLYGPEYSATFILDGGGNAVATSLSRDHKALYDGGLGPNTGGLGAFAPLTNGQALYPRRNEIENIGLKIANGLLEDGLNYRGAICVGLMAETDDPTSALRILEFNVRFGDPETQVILPSLGGTAIDLMHDSALGVIESDMSRLYDRAGANLVTLTVCLATPGYSLEGAELVTNLPVHVPQLPDDISIQFAGAKRQGENIVSSGGRVVYITKTGTSIEDARTVYDYIGRDKGGVYIGDDQQVYRTDIGLF
jgi:phosphoribosylamine--glycine ligase